VCSTRRVPLVVPARRTSLVDVMGMVRRLDLEYRTRDEVDAIADLVARLLPDPALGRLGLVELLLNAIEHGNLEIGRALKGRLLREHRFEDELAARLARDPYRTRRAHVRVEVLHPIVEIEIRDDGPGFAWRNALDAGMPDDEVPGGRGIALVRRLCFPTLTYRDPGNVAIARLELPP